MKCVYPAIIAPEDGMYNVTFPDLPDCYTCGDDLADAVYMAEDVLACYLELEEREGRAVPQASAAVTLKAPSDSVVTLVFADTEAYRKKLSTRSVKKTLSIPQWLNEAAESRGVNFSQILQEALKTELGLA